MIDADGRAWPDSPGALSLTAVVGAGECFGCGDEDDNEQRDKAMGDLGNGEQGGGKDKEEEDEDEDEDEDEEEGKEEEEEEDENEEEDKEEEEDENEEEDEEKEEDEDEEEDEEEKEDADNGAKRIKSPMNFEELQPMPLGPQKEHYLQRLKRSRCLKQVKKHPKKNKE
uniref:Prothymosin alpha-like n=1 Tax=Globodera pallida TaxID=36090 RepID=A0A183C5D4_GLOPA